MTMPPFGRVWAKWFAWHPVPTDTGWKWLVYVEWQYDITQLMAPIIFRTIKKENRNG